MTLNFSHLVLKNKWSLRSVNHKHLNIRPTHKHRDDHEEKSETSFVSSSIKRKELVANLVDKPKDIFQRSFKRDKMQVKTIRGIY